MTLGLLLMLPVSHMLKSQWNDKAGGMMRHFYLCLSKEIKHRFATVDLRSSFEVLVELVIKIDSQLLGRERLCESLTLRSVSIGGSWML